MVETREIVQVSRVRKELETLIKSCIIEIQNLDSVTYLDLHTIRSELSCCEYGTGEKMPSFLNLFPTHIHRVMYWKKRDFSKWWRFRWLRREQDVLFLVTEPKIVLDAENTPYLDEVQYYVRDPDCIVSIQKRIIEFASQYKVREVKRILGCFEDDE